MSDPRYSQTQKLSQQQKLTPQYIQYLKVLQIPNHKLDLFLRKEMEENPVLEYDTEQAEQDYNKDDVSSDINVIEKEANKDDSLSDNDENQYTIYDKKEQSNFLQSAISYKASPFENLHNQLVNLELDKEELKIADIIIGNLDSSGYLRTNLQLIANDFEIKNNKAITTEQIVEVLEKIQTLEPTGVGARNLQECLILQLKKIESWSLRDTAIEIILKSSKYIMDLDYNFLQENYDLSSKQLKEIIQTIQNLNPKPGLLLDHSNKEANSPIKPDFIVYKKDNHFDIEVVSIYERNIKYNSSYIKIIEDAKNGKKIEPKTLKFIKDKVEKVKNLHIAFTQKRQVSELVMKEIVKKQKDYFNSGEDKDLQPFLVKDLAHKLEMENSVLSKIISKKYVQTSYGILPLKKFFFEKSFNQKGEEIKVHFVQNELKNIIESEDNQNPFTDLQLQDLLLKKGYDIARRTIAKYREQLNISKASFRKKVF